MRSLKTKGTIFVFIMLLSFIFVMFPLSHGITEGWLRNGLNENLQNSATTIQEFTDDHLLQYIGPLERLSEMPEIKSMNWEEQRKILDQQVTLDYKELAIVDDIGMAYYTDGSAVDLSDRNYVKKVLTGEFNISKVITSRVTGEKVMMIAYPIHRGEEVVGALIARIEPNFLSDFLKEDAGGLYSFYFVLDQEGYLKIHPKKEYVIENLNFLEQRGKQEDIENLDLLIENSFDNKKGYGSYEESGEEIVLGYAHLKTLDWVLYVGRYEKDLTAGIQVFDSVYLGAGIFLVLLLAGVSWFITKTFADPVLELESQFQKAAKGDLNVRSNIDRNDELGRASENFNRMMDNMKTLTYYDPVTKLPNQNVFIEQFQQIVSSEGEFRVKESAKEMSVVLLSLKGFSKINERFGYSHGDRVLRELTRRIRVILPENTKIFRGKGDQFILWNSDRKSEEDLLILSERLITKIEWPIEDEAGETRIACHIGISQYPKDGLDSENLIKKSTFACNYSKQVRGEKIRIFDEGLYEKEIDESNLLEEINRGLTNQEFELYYQPIYQLDTMKIEGTEALIRWNHPREGFVSPGRFIPLAEKNGAIKRIDYYVINKAVEQIKTWEKTACKELIISVNLSADTFEDPFFENWLVNLVKEKSIDSGKIQLELTERVILEDINQVISKFNRLRKNGFKIAIDDFGVGYSSLSYLVKLPIDQLKIDQSFTQNLLKGKESKAVISTVVNMGKELNLSIIAEGIEREEELQYLKSIHCPLGQGFLLERPIPKEEIEKIFDNE